MKRQRAMDVPTIPLSSGVLMPLLGFGTWGGKDDARMVAAAVRTAITENGFRSIDCAECYKNEAAIGEVLEDVIASEVVSRDELFITSKVWNTNHAAEHVSATSLKPTSPLSILSGSDSVCRSARLASARSPICASRSSISTWCTGRLRGSTLGPISSGVLTRRACPWTRRATR
jgi:hypothetical protein